MRDVRSVCRKRRIHQHKRDELPEQHRAALRTQTHSCFIKPTAGRMNVQYVMTALTKWERKGLTQIRTKLNPPGHLGNHALSITPTGSIK